MMPLHYGKLVDCHPGSVSRVSLMPDLLGLGASRRFLHTLGHFGIMSTTVPEAQCICFVLIGIFDVVAVAIPGAP